MRIDLIQLEELIDQHGLKVIIEGLADICYLKEEHIKENWQDEKAAKTWRKDAALLTNTTIKLKN